MINYLKISEIVTFLEHLVIVIPNEKSNTIIIS